MATSSSISGSRGNTSREEDPPGPSVFTGMLLVVPGIALYVYIVYIMISKLVYPASFLPFTHHPAVTEDEPETYSLGEGTLGVLSVSKGLYI